MKLVYDKSYWADYYGGSYADTFHYGFPLERILAAWDSVFAGRPRSFADIGCGPGHTLALASKLMPGADVWGVEVQDIPERERVHANITIGDFLDLSKDLKPAEFLYSSCSMYVPWKDQPYFISECLRLATKAVCFPNVYLEDGQGIPDDPLRKVIYTSREAFSRGIEGVAGWRRAPGSHDLFYRST